MRSRDARSLVANAASLGAARLLPRLLQIGYVILLARSLGPELYGLFAYAQSSYLTVLPLTSFGLYVLLARLAGTDRAAMPAALAQTLTFRIWVAGLAALLAAGAAYFWEPDAVARTLLAIFAVALLGRAIVMWTEHVFVAFESAHYALRCELFFRPLESGLGILLLLSGRRAVACVVLHAVVCWLQAAAALAIVHRRLAPIGLGLTWRKARELLSFGWPFSLNVFSTGLLLQGPMVLYRPLAPSELHIGQIAVPLQALALLGILPGAAATSALPVLARLGQRADGSDLRVMQRMIGLGYGFGAAVGLIGLAVGPWLVERILGARYATAGALIGPALWLVIPYTCGSVLTSLALVRGQIRTAVVCSMAGALALGAAGPALTHTWEQAGMLGAAALALACWVGMLLASGVGEITACVVRPLCWVGVAFGCYRLLSLINPMLGLATGLLALLWTARLFGIAAPKELRALRNLYGSGPG
jgi:O-antigen/teichoic acid export membrane protein